MAASARGRPSRRVLRQHPQPLRAPAPHTPIVPALPLKMQGRRRQSGCSPVGLRLRLARPATPLGRAWALQDPHSSTNSQRAGRAEQRDVEDAGAGYPRQASPLTGPRPSRRCRARPRAPHAPTSARPHRPARSACVSARRWPGSCALARICSRVRNAGAPALSNLPSAGVARLRAPAVCGRGDRQRRPPAPPVAGGGSRVVAAVIARLLVAVRRIALRCARCCLCSVLCTLHDYILTTASPPAQRPSRLQPTRTAPLGPRHPPEYGHPARLAI